MINFIVGVREVHIQNIKISAKNRKNAIKKVEDGEGTLIDMGYSHTLESNTWTISKEDTSTIEQR